MNLLWGGIESHQVGTHEFVDFCRQVSAEPFFAVNFEADGRGRWAQPAKGGPRTAGPEEAAAWIDYCNNPDNRERIANGAREPFGLRLWQIGNETSYDPTGYDLRNRGPAHGGLCRGDAQGRPGHRADRLGRLGMGAAHARGGGGAPAVHRLPPHDPAGKGRRLAPQGPGVAAERLALP